MAQSWQEAMQHQDFVPLSPKQLGFLINFQKSGLAPSKTFTFFWLQWDTEVSSVSFTEEKIDK